MPGAKKLKTSEYASAIIENMQAAVRQRAIEALVAATSTRQFNA